MYTLRLVNLSKLTVRSCCKLQALSLQTFSNLSRKSSHTRRQVSYTTDACHNWRLFFPPTCLVFHGQGAKAAFSLAGATKCYDKKL